MNAARLNACLTATIPPYRGYSYPDIAANNDDNDLPKYSIMKTSLFNLHDVAILLSIALSLCIALSQGVSSRLSPSARIFISLFFVNLGLCLAGTLMFWKPELRISAAMNSALFPYVLQSLVLLKGPLLLACAVSLAPTQPAAYTRYAYHFAIAITVGMYLLVKGSGSLYAQDFLLSPHNFVWVLSLNEWHFIKIMPVFYAGLALYHLRKYAATTHQSPSSKDGWIYLFVVGMTINWGWSFFTHIMGNLVGVAMSDQLGIMDNYVSLILLGALLTYRLIVVENTVAALAPETVDSLSSSSDDTIIKDLPIAPEKLITAMRDDQLFLDARLNVERLAEHLGCSPRDISITINQYFNTHFFDFLNRFRIDEAKRLLADPAYAELTISDIFKMAGFNSKSAFHRAFSKSVGITPSDFRRNAHPSSINDQHCAHSS